MTEYPLVSICVLTYNASRFVLETLESIKKQSYINIELIIGDDNSKDNTVELCYNWTEKNKDRFKSVEIISQKENKGVSGNLNSCYKKTKGKWIKIIAGDDLLLENCIKDNVEYAESREGINFVFSRMKHFSGDEFNDGSILNINDNYTSKYFSSDEKTRFFMLVRKNPFPAPTFFHRNGIIQLLGGYDTKYRFEDWPMWVKLAENNYHIDFLEKYTVAYRHHSTSSSSSSIRLFNMNLETDIYRFRKSVCFIYYSNSERNFIKLDYRLKYPT